MAKTPKPFLSFDKDKKEIACGTSFQSRIWNSISLENVIHQTLI
jgi:hypothetical protein